MEKIGLIPAAGLANRLRSPAFSKELLPVSLNKDKEKLTLKTVSTYLFEKYRCAGVKSVYAILRKGKWDIIDHFGDGGALGIRLAYLIMNYPYGVPYTVDQAYPFIKSSRVCFGFPDILFEPENAFKIAEGTLESTNADLLLGLYPIKDERQMQQSDMVQFESGLRITKILVKPESSDLKFSWIFAIWNPHFSAFLHDYLKHDLPKRQNNLKQTEIHFGHVVQAALKSGLAVFGHLFSDYNFIDVGTPENYALALKQYMIGKKWHDILSKAGL